MPVIDNDQNKRVVGIISFGNLRTISKIKKPGARQLKNPKSLVNCPHLLTYLILSPRELVFNESLNIYYSMKEFNYEHN